MTDDSRGLVERLRASARQCLSSLYADVYNEAADALEASLAREERLRSALKGLSDMYVNTWDLVNGDLVMPADGVERFEAAHAKARAALSTPSTAHRARARK